MQRSLVDGTSKQELKDTVNIYTLIMSSEDVNFYEYFKVKINKIIWTNKKIINNLKLSIYK